MTRLLATLELAPGLAAVSGGAAGLILGFLTLLSGA